MPTKAPSQPIIACQPWRSAASTPTSGALAEDRGAVGRVLRCEELERRRRDHGGGDAARPARRSAAASAIATSEPVATSVTARGASGSRST